MAHSAPLPGDMDRLIAASHTTRWRRGRFVRFARLLEAAARARGGAPVRVLDLGGTVEYWQGLAPVWQHLPLDVTLVNLGGEPRDEGLFHVRPGNACALPEHADGAFDVVHSNSVVEHVGNWERMEAMAAEVRRLAPRYFVQTPNLWFPYEPHYRAPFIHWLPEPVRAAIVLRRGTGFFGGYADFGAAMRDVQSIDHLDARAMRALFPDARLERERFCGLTKSLIAIREARA